MSRILTQFRDGGNKQVALILCPGVGIKFNMPRKFSAENTGHSGCRVKTNLFERYTRSTDEIASTGDYVRASDNCECVTSRAPRPLSASCTHVRTWMRAASMISATKRQLFSLVKQSAPGRGLCSPNRCLHRKLRHCH